MEKRNVIRLITSVLISVALWVYVINVVNPSSTATVRNIPVTLTGTETLYEKNLAIDGGGTYTVDITVRAARTELSFLTADNFTATADVSELTLGQDYITVDVKAPKGYTVEDIRSRKIQVYVDELAIKTVPVTAVCSGSAGNGYEATVVSVYPEYIEISGAKNIVDKAEGFVVPVNAQDLEYENISEFTVSGFAGDASGNRLAGLAVSDPEISVRAVAYSTKTVVLRCTMTGEPWANAEIIKQTIPTTINIKGSMTAITGVSEIIAEAIDISGISEDVSMDIVPLLPEGVYVADRDKNLKAVIDISDSGSISFVYYEDSVTINGLPDNLYALCTIPSPGYIRVTVSGPLTALKTMSESDISLGIDASKLSTGTKDVKVTASTSIAGVNISLSPQTVSVYVRER